MRIGLLTFHFADNYGALLQTFATISFLEKAGHSVEVINYIPGSNKSNGRIWTLRSIIGVFFRIIVWPARRKRKQHLKRFRKHLPLSKEYRNKSEIDYSQYDCIITGSDQTFNLNYGFTDVYYLMDVKNVFKVAFASSFGSYDYTKLSQPYVKALRRFGSLSIRELQPVRYLVDHYDILVSHVLDPVFLLGKDEWLTLMQKPTQEKFVFVYDLNGRDNLIKMALDDYKGSKIIVFSNDPLWRFKSKYSGQVTFIDELSVELFLGYINVASHVYTDSFHGFAFSVLLEKPLTVYIALPQAAERILSLLSMLKYQPVSQSINRYDIDTVKYKENLVWDINHSKCFLLTSIEKQ